MVVAEFVLVAFVVGIVTQSWLGLVGTYLGRSGKRLEARSSTPSIASSPDLRRHRHCATTAGSLTL